MSFRTRGWCFTVFNDFELCKLVIQSADYSIIGKEIAPTTGREHLQCYAYWHDKKSGGALIKALPKEFGRLFAAKGSPKSNQKYCSKDGDFEEDGDLPQQGERNDIAEFRDAILDGMSEEELIMEYPNMMARYDRFYQRCRNLVLKKVARKNIDTTPEVIVIIGDSGIGKSRTCYDNEKIEDIYPLETGDGSKDSVFWCGYNGEEVILIDDFHSDLKLNYMLRLLDRYPMKLNIKGSHTYKCAKRIYITSNIEVNQWYPNCASRHKDALKRRITKTIDLRPNIDTFKDLLDS